MQILKLSSIICDCKNNQNYLFEYVSSEFDFKSVIEIRNNKFYNKYNIDICDKQHVYINADIIIQILDKKIKFYENAPRYKLKFTLYTEITNFEKTDTVYSILKLSPDTHTIKEIETVNIINGKMYHLDKINNIVIEFYNKSPWKMQYFTTIDQYIWKIQ